MTEDESKEQFDDAIERSCLFRNYKEVEGRYLHPRFGTFEKGARIDRLLIPEESVVESGWKGGPIGVEIKKEKSHLGHAVCQALDYSRCAFAVRAGFNVVLEWVFLYPFGSPSGDIASVMSQNRIGSCYMDREGRMRFTVCGQTLMCIGCNNEVEVSPPLMGNKRGSR